MSKIIYRAVVKPDKQRKTKAYEESDDDYTDDLSGVYVPTVSQDEPYWQDTGLVDLGGYPIHRYVAPNPIGFIWPTEEDDEI